MSTVHIHAPQPTIRRAVRNHCPTCQRRTWSLAFFTEWYGWHTTCLCCGDEWTDGEMHERPFRPRWRKENVEAAKKRWREWKEPADAAT